MKTSVKESLAYYAVKIFGGLIRCLPHRLALAIGRVVGVVAYYLDVRHKALVLANLKIAFSSHKSPDEIKQIAKRLFQNFGQNFIELLRLPLLTRDSFFHHVTVEGREHVSEALKGGKGVILLAMHFGSWELAGVAGAMMERPYKVIVKPQRRYKQLDDLLNSFRRAGGSMIIERGMGTREFIKSLKNNEIVAMVADQGGKSGMLVPFFDRQASMSVGAIRMGLKLNVPICFVVIYREGQRHRLIIHKPLELERSADPQEDVRHNLIKATRLMESYIREHPDEYMWFYKIWKYSRESTAVILSDQRTGHLQQSRAVGMALEGALQERSIALTTKMVDVKYRNSLRARCLSLLSLLGLEIFYQGRLSFLRWFLDEDSFQRLMSIKADFIISCGSSIASLNYLLSVDQQAKSIAVLRPGILPYNRFDLVILPEHDRRLGRERGAKVVYTKGAPNLITPQLLEEHREALLKRFSHLKQGDNVKIGLLLGGDAKDYTLEKRKIRMVIHQIKEVAEEIRADILVTTSRRTSTQIENLCLRELKKYPACRLLVIANRNPVAEAMGGILGLADILVVSGDSISMVSEAATSGKNTIVFPVAANSQIIQRLHKHNHFIEGMHAQGYVLCSDPQNLKRAIYDVFKGKIHLKAMEDQSLIVRGIRHII
jgi:KDO2-lipid IV(A) lauroyltransferase